MNLKRCDKTHMKIVNANLTEVIPLLNEESEVKNLAKHHYPQSGSHQSEKSALHRNTTGQLFKKRV